jgi:hypothetical protein
MRIEASYEVHGSEYKFESEGKPEHVFSELRCLVRRCDDHARSAAKRAKAEQYREANRANAD